LGIGLILARSPQAKGRVERFFRTAQDRWVKEMRLAGVTTRAQANALARRLLIPQFNRRFAVTPAGAADGHRPQEAEPPGVQPTAGRSGCTPAEPCPPGGGAEDSKKGPYRPAANHPWRKGFPKP
jgi:hypothetical protein